jgi:hypothetical protein
MPDAWNKKSQIALFRKATRLSTFRPVAFRLPITRDLALSFGCDAHLFAITMPKHYIAFIQILKYFSIKIIFKN